jgi:hypothetical protein
MSEREQYIPGVCNIGKQETKQRRNAAIVGGIMAVIIAGTLVTLHLDKAWRFIVVLPLLSFGVGIQQWYYKFCVRFGMKGLFNFGDLGATHTVEQAEMHKADRNKALRMIIIGLLFAVAVAVGFYLLPV